MSMDNKNKLKESRNKEIDPQLKQDLNDHFDNALNSYKNKVESMSRVLEQDELIKILYDHKLEAITNFNKVLNSNQDAFSITSSLSAYNSTRKLLELEIDKIETRQLDLNVSKSEQLCQKLLTDSYTPVISIKYRLSKR
jgi:hypothetical protein